mmetsp:Transcript_2449/g.8984  ORF Transcript_2449/g.8984 Transcript_2449/m.8984 type:complete len:325 (-) Transcript_2449:746-1720(-)
MSSAAALEALAAREARNEALERRTQMSVRAAEEALAQQERRAYEAPLSGSVSEPLRAVEPAAAAEEEEAGWGMEVGGEPAGLAEGAAAASSGAPAPGPAPSLPRSATPPSAAAGGEQRLAKARVKALQDEVAAQAKELREREASEKELNKELKSLLAERGVWQKQEKALRAAADKAKRAADEAKAEAEARAKECEELRRERERAARAAKASEGDAKTRDVRLNRALEEVERYRRLLEEAKEEAGARAAAGEGGAAAGASGGARQNLDRLTAENKRLERQKQELVAAFKKQQKLIDVLKKQKAHMEVARLLHFTEEEFQKTLSAH